MKIDFVEIKNKIKRCKSIKGYKSADVANTAIRNLLSELMADELDEIYFQEALDFFDFKCPYTGVDLDEISMVTIDHIVPQNREECGLNIKGNVVFASKKANQAKGSKSFAVYIDSLKNVDDIVKQERKNKIIEFQAKYNYSPNYYKGKIQIQLETIYKEIQKNQDNYLNDLKKLL